MNNVGVQTQQKADKPQRIIRAPKSEPYFAMPRATAQDRNLSFEARGVLSYLLSKPNDWEVQPRDLQQDCGRGKVYKILKELEDAFYLTRSPVRDKGRLAGWEYHVHATPCDENQHKVNTPPRDDLPHAEKQHAENRHTTYKREEQIIEFTEIPLRVSAQSASHAADGSHEPPRAAPEAVAVDSPNSIPQSKSIEDPLQSSAKVSPAPVFTDATQLAYDAGGTLYAMGKACNGALAGWWADLMSGTPHAGEAPPYDIEQAFFKGWDVSRVRYVRESAGAVLGKSARRQENDKTGRIETTHKVEGNSTPSNSDICGTGSGNTPDGYGPRASLPVLVEGYRWRHMGGEWRNSADFLKYGAVDRYISHICSGKGFIPLCKAATKNGYEDSEFQNKDGTWRTEHSLFAACPDCVAAYTARTAAKPKAERARDLVFDAIASGSFGMGRVSGDGGRVGRLKKQVIECTAPEHLPTLAADLEAAYKWWRETKRKNGEPMGIPASRETICGMLRDWREMISQQPKRTIYDPACPKCSGGGYILTENTATPCDCGKVEA